MSEVPASSGAPESVTDGGSLTPVWVDPAQRRRRQPDTPGLGLLLVAVQLAVLVWGWDYWRLPQGARDAHPLADVLDPAAGGGQLLGITGFVLLWLAAGYSLAKLAPFARLLPPPSMGLWLHVAAGTLAPLFVLQHCGLALGGLAGLAAIGLVVVALLGVVGRVVMGRLAALVETSRARGQLPKALLLRASACTDPARPHMPDPAVLDAIEALEELPLEGRSPLRTLGTERDIRRAARRIRAGIAASEVPERVRRHIRRSLQRSLQARATLLRAEAARRALRWWRVLHVALSHAVLVLATIHAGLALSYSGTVERIRALWGG